MAINPIAYSEITILDLVDTATYIYYADKNPAEDNSAVIKTVPSEEDFVAKYIGIYNGPIIHGKNLIGFYNATLNWNNTSSLKFSSGVISRTATTKDDDGLLSTYLIPTDFFTGHSI
jgi:hypothetical protein